MPRDWDAETYDRVAHPEVRWAAGVVDELELVGDETAVDAGCGSGRVTELLARRLPRGRIVALDGSASISIRRGGGSNPSVTGSRSWSPT